MLCPDVNKIDPSVNRDTPLPHVPSCVIGGNGAISEIPNAPRITKHMLIKALGDVRSVDIRHRLVPTKLQNPQN